MGRTGKKLQKHPFSIRERLRSFRYAFRGLDTMFRHEHNMRIHLAVFICVVIAGALVKLPPADWLAILIASGLVFASECFNTALEYLSDGITGERNDFIGRAKDVAAAGVLIASVAAIATGLIIFLPRLIDFAGGVFS